MGPEMERIGGVGTMNVTSAIDLHLRGLAGDFLMHYTTLFSDTTLSLAKSTDDTGCFGHSGCLSYCFPGQAQSLVYDPSIVPRSNETEVLIQRHALGLQIDLWPQTSEEAFVMDDCVVLGTNLAAMLLCVKSSTPDPNIIVAGPPISVA